MFRYAANEAHKRAEHSRRLAEYAKAHNLPTTPHTRDVKKYELEHSQYLGKSNTQERRS